MRKIIPYPLRSAKISIDIMPFGFWWKPTFYRREEMSEKRKRNGDALWWARWAWFQISYSRWV